MDVLPSEVSTFGKVAKSGHMDGMDQVYYYSTIFIFQDPIPEYIKKRWKIAGVNVNTLNFYKYGLAGIWTPGLFHAKEAIYLWSTSPEKQDTH